MGSTILSIFPNRLDTVAYVTGQGRLEVSRVELPGGTVGDWSSWREHECAVPSLVLDGSESAIVQIIDVTTAERFQWRKLHVTPLI